MCGVWVTVGLPPLPAAVQAVARRGPDDSGECERQTPAGPLRLAHRRLAISDLGGASAQPFTLEGRDLDLVWNGAVYDFRERRAALAAAGVTMRSQGDTEVLAHLLANRRLESLADLDAMFALAWFDRRTQRLTLARDRFGEKPLLWASGRSADGPWFAAGSDLRQFIEIPGFDRRLNVEQAAAFLNWGAADAPDGTFMAEVRRLPAGCALELDLSSPEAFARSLVDTPRAWPGARLAPDRRAGSPEAAAEAVLDALGGAVWRRLTSSDVPYGACLSGGLDSSLILGLMRRLGDSPIGVSALVDDPSVSERPWVEALRSDLQLDIVEVAGDAASAAEALAPALDAQGEPAPHTSIVLQWMVFRSARARGLKVMLDGQGADELFGGYPTMLGVWLAEHLRAEGPASWSREIRKLTAGDSGLTAAGLRRATFRALVPERARRSALTLAGRWPPRAPLAHGSPPPPRANQSFQELCETLVERDSLPTLLRYEDRNAMDHGVETRLPYLAPQVAALAAGLPAALKVRDGWRKAPLRDAAHGLIPEAVRNRRRKLGFSTPHEAWTAGPVGDLCRTWVRDLAGTPAAALLRRPGETPTDANELFRVAAYLRWADRLGVAL